jgi:hypothetical protein
VSDIREWLIRQNFEHERDYYYVTFRKHHWNDPEIIKAVPDEKLREKMLRGFWNQDAEKRFPEYRAAVAGLTIAELQREREEWIEKLDCLGVLEYRQMLADAARRQVANDNKKEIER